MTTVNLTKQVSRLVNSALPVILLSIFLFSCVANKAAKPDSATKYISKDKELYKSIAAMDSMFFAAYNTCDLEKQAYIYAEEIEFFHDQGGLMTSKQAIIDGTEKNICGKVTRELVQGSIEVYPIKGYGAVEIGYHKFYNNREPDAPSYPSKFIIMWQYVDTEWKISKVISLH